MSTQSQGTGPWLRSDGRWEAQYVDAAGRKRSVYGPSERETKRRLRDRLDERDRGVAGSRATVGGWLDDWLIRLDKAPTTMANYRYLCSLVPGWFRRLRLDDQEVTPAKVARLLDELSASTTKHGKPRAPKTVLEVRMVLRRSLGQAQRWGILSRNAAALVDPPELDVDDPDYLDLADARTLLAAVEGHRLESLYTVALAHGLRESEVIGARWPYVNLAEGWIEVWPTITRTSEGDVVEGVTKSRRKRRIALTATGVEQLRRHRAGLAEERLALGEAWADSDLVWPSRVGTPLMHRNLLRHLHQTCDRAGIRRVSFHTLRHSAATLMLAQGVDWRVVMEVLGHSSPAMVRRYQHVVEDLKRGAAAAMDAALTGRSPSETPSGEGADAEIVELGGGGDRI